MCNLSILLTAIKVPSTQEIVSYLLWSRVIGYLYTAQIPVKTQRGEKYITKSKDIKKEKKIFLDSVPPTSVTNSVLTMYLFKRNEMSSYKTQHPVNRSFRSHKWEEEEKRNVHRKLRRTTLYIEWRV